ncbi:MAG TPA: OB-fold nucleic acid binding domain-containing protein, partial [Isosphaeraceae bacterium]
KKALGFYMTSHPLTRHGALLQAFRTHQVADLADVPEKAEVTLGGMIAGVQVRNVQKSRSGLTRMAKLTFEDLSGSVPAMLWPEDFAKNEGLVKPDTIVFVRGALDRRRDPAELIISRIIPLERAPAELSRGVVVRLHKGVHQAEDLERLHRLIRIRPGNLDLYLEIVGLGRVSRAVFKAGTALKIRHDERLVPELEAAIGAGNVRLLGQGGATARVSAPAPSRPIAAVDPPEDDPEES